MESGQAHPGSSGWRILIAGTGGQGILTAARLLCDYFVEQGYEVVSGQLHGMAQRGGAVQSSVIIDGGVSPVIAQGRADYVLGFEPVETVRALPLMGPHTAVFMNTSPVVPFVLSQQQARKEANGRYPEVKRLIESIKAVTPQVSVLDATQVAQEAGDIRSLNMVMLGCLIGSGLAGCSVDAFWERAASNMPPASGQINGLAFWKGVQAVAGLAIGGSMR